DHLAAHREQRLTRAAHLFGRRAVLGRRLDAALAQLPARAGDREAVRVEQLLHLAERLDVLARVDALALRRLLGPDRGELRLPVAEHVRLDADEPGHLTDPEVELLRKLVAHTRSASATA